MSKTEAKILIKGRTRYLHIHGFLYIKSSETKNGKVYWRCRRKNQCRARAITIGNDGDTITFLDGGVYESHYHAPDREEVEALKTIIGIKRSAIYHPGSVPSKILKTLDETRPAVLAQLPNPANIVKQIRRERLRKNPTDSQSVENLDGMPKKARITSARNELGKTKRVTNLRKTSSES